MGKRIYVRPEDDKPKPLKSNWPNMGMPVDGSVSFDIAMSVNKQTALNHHQHYWKYLIYKGENLIGEYKSKKLALKMFALVKHEKGTWFYAHEPTEDDLHEQRQKDKATWRWQAGFGA